MSRFTQLSFLLLALTASASAAAAQPFRAEDIARAVAASELTTPPVRLQLPSGLPLWNFTGRIQAVAGDLREEADFRHLRDDRGVRTILSIDEAPPGRTPAGRLGMSHLHNPVRPGRIEPAELYQILRTIIETQGNYLLHSRAADGRVLAIASLAAAWDEGQGNNRASVFFQGTGYETPERMAGLWSDILDRYDDVRYFAAEAQPFELRFDAPPRSLPQVMRDAGRAFDILAEAQAHHQWASPQAHSDTTPAYEARTVADTFAQWIAADPPVEPPMKALMEETITKARALNEALLNGSREAADVAFWDLAVSCQTCHRQFRPAEAGAGSSASLR
ncbi:MAG: hypothetical protein RLY93_10385 [Sumerlaeia bacterium]